MADLTREEQAAIRALTRLSSRWPRSLWLFAASGSMMVMRVDEHGERAENEHGGVDRRQIVGRVSIPCDGGDW